MTHCMNLELSAFLKIANGSKTIELRLNDKKRQKINIGDRIEFRCSEINSVIFAEVIKLHKFLDFEQLYKALPLEKCGYSKNDLKSAHYTDMEKYYTKEQIEKYEFWGLLLFVGIPLPGTGAWTGSLIAALLGIKFKKAFPAVILGILLASFIMTVLSYTVIGGIFA